MSSRVTEGLVFSKSQDAVYKARDKMLKNQEAAVTGKMVNRASDNPVNTMRAIGLTAQLKRDEQVSANMDILSGMLSVADSTLSEFTEVLTRAKELAIQMSSSTNSGPEARQAVANEVDQLFMRAVQLSNARFGDRYIFGGHQTDRAPFDKDGNYFGDAGEIEIEIDKGQKTAVSIPGSLAFLGLKTFPQEGQAVRSDPAKDGQPSLQTQMRTPAAVQLGPDGKPILEDKATRDQAQRDLDAKNLVEGLATNKGVNIFRSLKSLADALKNGEMPMVNQAIDDMDDAFNQVLQARTLIGAKQNIFKSGLESLEASKVNNSDQISKVRDADIIGVFSELTRNEQTLNATLEASKKLLTPSLIDFLK